MQKEFCRFYAVLVFSWSHMTAMEMQIMFQLFFKLKANQFEKPAPNPNLATIESFSLTHRVSNLNYDLILKWHATSTETQNLIASLKLWRDAIYLFCQGLWGE